LFKIAISEYAICSSFFNSKKKKEEELGEQIASEIPLLLFLYFWISLFNF